MVCSGVKCLFALGVLVSICSSCLPSAKGKYDTVETTYKTQPGPTFANECELVKDGYGPKGQVPIRVETLYSGLTVPWAIAFIDAKNFLFTERTGKVRLVRNGTLVEKPVVEITPSSSSEGGLLGIALHPQFNQTRFFYVYYTAESAGGAEVNRVARYRLSADRTSASLDRIVLDNIPASAVHDGGRIHFGPDGMLYIGTGDARVTERSQQPDSLGGKILRVTPEGAIPADSPFPGSAAYILGVRNVQGFDWYTRDALLVADHGPSGELGRSGHDEVNFAHGGDNLGWPETWRCDEAPSRVRPFIVWEQAAPPGGLAYYTGDLIPEWKNSALVATLGSRHLHRLVLEQSAGVVRMTRHEVYLDGTYGRLREVIQAPDGSLYVTTSNCDGRGTCGSERDRILRISK